MRVRFSKPVALFILALTMSGAAHAEEVGAIPSEPVKQEIVKDDAANTLKDDGKVIEDATVTKSDEGTTELKADEGVKEEAPVTTGGHE